MNENKIAFRLTINDAMKEYKAETIRALRRAMDIGLKESLDICTKVVDTPGGAMLVMTDSQFGRFAAHTFAHSLGFTAYVISDVRMITQSPVLIDLSTYEPPVIKRFAVM